jgi:hypothetical protein
MADIAAMLANTKQAKRAVAEKDEQFFRNERSCFKVASKLQTAVPILNRNGGKKLHEKVPACG